MKVYISLPVTGNDLEQKKRYALDIAAFLLELGATPVLPFGKPGVPDDAPYETHIRENLKLLLDCDVIYQCHGWSQSTGCVLEDNVAEMCGLGFITEGLRPDTVRILLKEYEERKEASHEH